jgi:hypothetical protein
VLGQDSGQSNAAGVLVDPWYRRRPSSRRRIATLDDEESAYPAWRLYRKLRRSAALFTRFAWW